MRNLLARTLLGVRTGWLSLRRVGGATVLLAALVGAPGAVVAPCSAWGDQPCDDQEDDQRESILIATRTRPSPELAQPADVQGDTLEPIAESSDHHPELADDESWDAESSELAEAEEFGAALADLAAGGAGPIDQGPEVDLVDTNRRDIPADPAKFNDVQPGTSTRRDLVAAWGDPDDVIAADNSEVYVYDLEPFRVVEVLLTTDVVEAIKIELDRPVPSETLSKRLTLDRLEVVDVIGEEGEELGRVYPERGVLFMFKQPNDESLIPEPAIHYVSQVVIQPLDAQTFALRAENRLHGPYEKNIRDLRLALETDPVLAHARWLLAGIYLANGQGTLAESEAAKALNLDPNNSAYQLRWAQALMLLGRYDEAAREIRQVLDRTSTPQVVKAEALHQMARLAGRGDASLATKAIDFDNTAIQLADTLADSKNPKERHLAKELLIRAHLNIAQEIAHQSYKSKIESLSEWIGRASGLAEDYIETDGGSLEWRLVVAQQSLAALASFKSDKDPAPWVAEAQQTADELMDQYDDELWKQRIQWEVGVAYFHATQIEHLRMKTAAALRYGQLAIENLAEGAKSRQAVPACEQIVGRLYFYIGAVHAIHNMDHEKAVQWYDRAEPLLTAPRPASELIAPRRDGEELVSMGVSYWETGQQDRAVELTKAGAELIQQAVEDDILDKSSLAVPYNNLSAMCKEMGDAADAAKYAALAKNATTTRARRNTSTRTNSRTGQVQPAANSQRRASSSNGTQRRTASKSGPSSQRAANSGKSGSNMPQSARSSSAAAGSSQSSTPRPSPVDPRTARPEPQEPAELPIR